MTHPRVKSAVGNVLYVQFPTTSPPPAGGFLLDDSHGFDFSSLPEPPAIELDSPNPAEHPEFTGPRPRDSIFQIPRWTGREPDWW